MGDFATYDGTTAKRARLTERTKGFKPDPEKPGKYLQSGGVLAQLLDGEHGVWALTREDAAAGCFLYPLVENNPTPGPGESLGPETLTPGGDPLVITATRPIVPADLDAMKIAKGREVDNRTTELADAPFVYDAGDGQGPLQFAFALRDKVNLIGMLLFKDVAAYPREWYAADNLKKISIQNSAQLSQFAGAAFAQATAPYDAGNLVLDQINACTTPAEVDAVEDPR